MKPKDWQDVDNLIEDVGRATIERDRLEGEMNEQLADVKRRYAEIIGERDEEIADLEQKLEAFCEAHRSEMEPVKGGKGVVHKGPYGKVAFRACPPAIIFVKKAEKVLAALKARKLFNCIRTVEEPNKDVMLALDDVTLAAVHARKKPGEKFEVKPDYEAIESTVHEAAKAK